MIQLNVLHVKVELKRIWLFIKKLLRLTHEIEQVLEHEEDSLPCEYNPDVYFLHLYRYIRPQNYSGLYVGLNVSAELTVQELRKNGWRAKAVGVHDDNEIDKVLFAERPSHIIIKAFWVREDKLELLAKRYPSCQFIVCCHSKPSFLAMENLGFERLFQVLNVSSRMQNVHLAANNSEMAWVIKETTGRDCLYLPNLIPSKKNVEVKIFPTNAKTLKVGIFCAIRPLKNMLSQIYAAIMFCQIYDMKLELNVIITRSEMGGGPILKAIRNIFEHLDQDRFKLVEHEWMKHDDFMNLVSQMDVGLQVSFTESFNIVATDFMNCGVPIVTSPAVEWAPAEWDAEPDYIENIVQKISDWQFSSPQERQKLLDLGFEVLDEYNADGIKVYEQLAAKAKRW